jgi:hypothetical protein
MTQREWKEKNNFWNTHACFFCRFYHDEDEELLEGDREYCLEHEKNEYAERQKAFCREMRDDGVKDYILKNNEPSIEGCKKWLTDGYV